MTGPSSFEWLSDLDEARKMAQEQGKLVLLDFFSPT